jgi:hypothetical protein
VEDMCYRCNLDKHDVDELTNTKKSISKIYMESMVPNKAAKIVGDMKNIIWNYSELKHNN